MNKTKIFLLLIICFYGCAKKETVELPITTISEEAEETTRVEETTGAEET